MVKRFPNTTFASPRVAGSGVCAEQRRRANQTRTGIQAKVSSSPPSPLANANAPTCTRVALQRTAGASAPRHPVRGSGEMSLGVLPSTALCAQVHPRRASDRRGGRDSEFQRPKTNSDRTHCWCCVIAVTPLRASSPPQPPP